MPGYYERTIAKDRQEQLLRLLLERSQTRKQIRAATGWPYRAVRAYVDWACRMKLATTRADEQHSIVDLTIKGVYVAVGLIEPPEGPVDPRRNRRPHRRRRGPLPEPLGVKG